MFSASAIRCSARATSRSASLFRTHFRLLPLVHDSLASTKSHPRAFSASVCTNEATRNGISDQLRRVPTQPPHYILYLTGLQADTKKSDVLTLFSQFGHVTDVKIMPARKARCAGYIHFARKDAAVAAVTHWQTNGLELQNNPLHLDFSRPRARLPKKAPSDGIFVTNLPENVDTHDILGAFSQFGEIVHVKILYKIPHIRENAVVIFAQLTSAIAAEAASESSTGITLKGSPLYVDFLTPRIPQPPNSDLAVTDFPGTPVELEKVFSEYEGIEKINLHRSNSDTPGKIRAFVRFVDEEHATRAMEAVKAKETKWGSFGIAYAKPRPSAQAKAKAKSRLDARTENSYIFSSEQLQL